MKMAELCVEPRHLFRRKIRGLKPNAFAASRQNKIAASRQFVCAVVRARLFANEPHRKICAQ
jgi:hypothetical protein